jgi:O-antigen/teichoic acid export membrane protein
LVKFSNWTIPAAGRVIATKSAARYFAKAYDKHRREKQRFLAKLMEMAAWLLGMVVTGGYNPFFSVPFFIEDQLFAVE